LTLQRLHPVPHVKTRDNVATAKQKVNCVNAMNVYLGYDIKVDSRTGDYRIANDLKTFSLAF
jgi:predicted ATP-grasp superfamily ATP-dependent carboligase